MNILFLCNSVARQGTYFRWHNLAIGLGRLGHRVTVAAFDHQSVVRGARGENRDGVEYHILGGNRGQSFWSQESHPLAAWRGCHRHLGSFDVVHVFQPFLTSALPWLLGGAEIAPVVIYDWDDLWAGGLLAAPVDGLAARWQRGLTTWLEKSLPRRADHVTTCSEHLARLARERGARGTSVIPNGFWPAPFPEKTAARRQLGLREDCLYVGFMGRTITETELDWLGASLEVVAASPAPCRLAVCGMPEHLLKARASRHRESLDYLGMLTPEQSRGFAAAIDLGLLPLEDAPLNRARFPIKFAEYLAAGAPVLSTTVGPCADRSAGWPFVLTTQPGAAAWLQGLQDALHKLSQGRLPAVDARTVQSQLAWTVAAERLATVYQSVGLAGGAPQADRLAGPVRIAELAEP